MTDFTHDVGERNATIRAENNGENTQPHKFRRKTALMWALIAAITLFIALYEIFCNGWYAKKTGDTSVSQSLDALITRSLGCAAALLLLRLVGYACFHRPSRKGLLLSAPCYVTALLNPPILPLVFGTATLYVVGVGLFYRSLLYFAECFAVAAFEELLFRGGVFLVFAESRRQKPRGVFFAAIYSSALFACVHLLNLFVSSPLAVLLQTGYSFLLGGMCAFVFVVTKNISFSVALHAIFNFCGGFIERFGSGSWYTLPIILFTCVLGCLVAIHVLHRFIAFRGSDVDCFYVQPQKQRRESKKR